MDLPKAIADPGIDEAGRISLRHLAVGYKG